MSTTFPTTTESILQEEGAETTLIELAQQVAKAAADLRRVLHESEGRPWTVRELQDEAANGRSSSVMSIAFLRLLKAGEVSIDYATSLVEAA
jgi:hypothetical protein